MVHLCWLLGLSRKSKSYPIYFWLHCLAISPASRGDDWHLSRCAHPINEHEAKKGLKILPGRQSDTWPDCLEEASRISSLEKLDELLRMETDTSCDLQIGSLIQWYESLDKYPIIVDKNLPHSTTNEHLADEEKGRA